MNVGGEEGPPDAQNVDHALDLEGEGSTSDADASEGMQNERKSRDKEKQNVREEGAESRVASANEQGSNETECAGGESETDSKAEEETKTEENAAEPSAAKESSSVEGDDPKKRFVVFCLLEQWLSLLHWLLC